MALLRGEERWAKACIRAALGGLEVRQHDDGSGLSMHDLEIVYPDRRSAAVEVTATADSESIELWKLVNGDDGRWIEPGLAGGWGLTVLPSARAKELRAKLPSLLGELERRQLTDVWIDDDSRSRSPLVVVVRELRVVHAHQGPTGYPGSIYVTIDLPLERSGGVVPATGDALSTWLSSWLLEPHEADNRRKLARSAADERHLFVILPGFTTAPFGAAEVLMRQSGPLPTIPPDLPPEVTHVWAMSTWDSGDGFRWSPDGGWDRFTKVSTVD